MVSPGQSLIKMTEIQKKMKVLEMPDILNSWITISVAFRQLNTTNNIVI